MGAPRVVLARKRGGGASASRAIRATEVAWVRMRTGIAEWTLRARSVLYGERLYSCWFELR